MSDSADRAPPSRETPPSVLRMSADLEFTGERFVPGTPGMIAYEHGHRYAFALRHAHGRRVLDAACGEGYGTALLARAARTAFGVDIDARSVAHAQATYGHAPEVRYATASVTALPLPSASMDLVVSFETLEHLPAQDQPRMLAEFARVLAPDGLLVLSSPNRRRYSDERDYRNPFHLHELDRDELASLLDTAFPYRHWYHQVPFTASALWSETPGPLGEAWSVHEGAVEPARAPDGLYYVVIAAKEASALPAPEPWLSLYADREQTEWMRAEGAHAEVIRLDGLLAARDSALDAQTGHVRHLEELVAYRERIVEERDAQLAQCRASRAAQERDLAAAAAETASLREALAQREHDAAAAMAENARLERALAAQERIIQYRHSWLWWLQLPWVRARTLWQRMAGS